MPVNIMIGKFKELINIVIKIISIFLILFISTNQFIDKDILLKEYFFILFSYILACLTIKKSCKYIEINIFTALFYCLMLYLFIYTLISSSYTLSLLRLSGFILLFFSLRSNYKSTNTDNAIFISLCTLQAIYGLLQYFHIYHISSFFSIIGSYDNPAGFAACLSITFPLSFTLLSSIRPYKILAFLSIVISSIAILLSGSRAGIISTITVTIFFVSSNIVCKSYKYRKYLTPIGVFTGIAIFISLLLLKKDSASGRLLIWQVSWQMIKDNFLLGNGNNSFLANYMNYQAEYFIKNPDSKFIQLADNVLHPFNEYLLLIIEYGFIGLFLFIICLIILLRYTKISCPYILCLISLGIFSLFSYPLKYPFIWIISAYCLAIISKKINFSLCFNIHINIWIKSLSILIIIIGFTFLIKDIKFEYEWNKIAQLSLLGNTKKTLSKYEYLYQHWNGNPLFLYNYGAELNHIKEYTKSLSILHECKQYNNNYYVTILIADNYYNLKKWSVAEKYYITASKMCPNRFVPLYKLHLIYKTIKKNEKALELAHKILNKKVKTPSINIYLITEEMQQYINSTKTPKVTTQQ